MDMRDSLFKSGSLRDALDGKLQELRREVDGFDTNYLLNVSETQLADALVAKYSLEAPTLRRDEIAIADQRETDIDVSHDPLRVSFDRSGPVYVKGTAVTIAVPFDGSESLFRYQPSSYTLGGTPAAQIANGELRLTYSVLDHDQQQLHGRYERDLQTLDQYLGFIRQDVQGYTHSLRPTVEQLIGERKRRLLANADLAASLGVPIRRRDGDSATYAPPEIRRRPRIELPPASRDRFTPEPALPQEEYDHILTVLERSTAVMERSPSAFAVMGEEDLRFQLLVQLNGHYEIPGQAEAFNHTGKTDILLPYNGRNVFIAECKFWSGPKGFTATLDQLLAYTAWRDTKTAVLIFNRNRDHTGVVRKADSTAQEHSCFQRHLEQPGEAHLRYLFRHPADANRELYVALLVFHVPHSED
jgi:hypothetical protein